MSVRIKSAQGRFGGGCKTRGIAAGLMSVTLMTGCANMGGSATERAICEELRRDLPSWSRTDTEQSRREGADFLDSFNAACPV